MMKLAKTDFDKVYEALNECYLTEAKTKINLKKLLSKETPDYLAAFDVPGQLTANDIEMNLPNTIKQEYVNYLNQFSRLHIFEKANEPEDTVYHIHHINLESLGGVSELKNLIVLTAEQHQAVHNKLKELVDSYSGPEIINNIVVNKIRQAANICNKTKNTYSKYEISEAQSILKLNAKSSGGNEDTLQRGRFKQFKIIFNDGREIVVGGYEGIAQALNMQSTNWESLRKIIQKWFAVGKNHSDSYRKYGVKEIIGLDPKNEGEGKPLYIFKYIKSNGNIDWTISNTGRNYYESLSKAANILSLDSSDIGDRAAENHERLVAGYLPSHWTSKYNYVPVWVSDIGLLKNLLEREQ